MNRKDRSNLIDKIGLIIFLLFVGVSLIITASLNNEKLVWVSYLLLGIGFVISFGLSLYSLIDNYMYDKKKDERAEIHVAVDDEHKIYYPDLNHIADTLKYVNDLNDATWKVDVNNIDILNTPEKKSDKDKIIK